MGRAGTRVARAVSTWARVTAVTRRGGSGVYDVELDPDWGIVGKPNGGYLLATLARAGCDIVANPHPLAVSGHFLRAPHAGPAEIRVETVRQGRRVSTARATPWQEGKACLDALVTSGALENEKVARAPPPPQTPAPEHLAVESDIPTSRWRSSADRASGGPGHLRRSRPPSGEPPLRYRFRLRDGAEPTSTSAILATDCGAADGFQPRDVRLSTDRRAHRVGARGARTRRPCLRGHARRRWRTAGSTRRPTALGLDRPDGGAGPPARDGLQRLSGRTRQPDQPPIPVERTWRSRGRARRRPPAARSSSRAYVRTSRAGLLRTRDLPRVGATASLPRTWSRLRRRRLYIAWPRRGPRPSPPTLARRC